MPAPASAEPPAGFTRLPPWIPLVAIAAIWTVSFFAWGPSPFNGFDYVRFREPYHALFRDSLLRGEWPWWNPYASLGRPFAADLQSALLYPATWLIVPLGLRAGCIGAIFLHGLLGAAGFARLGRHFGASAGAGAAGGALFLFSSPIYGHLEEGQVNYAYALCYLPGILWLTARLVQAPSRRHWAALALAWTLVLLCGHPQACWIAAYGSGLFAAGLVVGPPWPLTWRQAGGAAGMLLAAGAVGAALAGVLLVPFLELVGQSNRALPSLAYAASFAMAPPQWLSLISPPGRAFGVNCEYDLYVGTAVAIGGAAALVRFRDPAARGAAFMAIGATLVAAGASTPAFSGLYRLLPGLRNFRTNSRAGTLVALALLLGAALLAGRRGRSRSTRRMDARLCLLAAAVAAWFGLLAYRRGLDASPDGRRWLLEEAALIAIAAAGWWLWLTTRADGEKDGDARPAGAREGTLRFWILPGAAAAGLFLAIDGIKLLYRFDSSFPAETILQEGLRAIGANRDAAPLRVCADPVLVRENAGMIWRFAGVVGFESLSLSRAWTYLSLACGTDPGTPYNSAPNVRIHDLAPSLRAFGLSASLPLQGSRIRLFSHPDPRAYFVRDFRTVGDAQKALEAMVSGADFHRTAIVEEKFAGSLSIPDDSGKEGTEEGGTDGPVGPAAPAAISRFALNSLEFQFPSAPRPRLLVVAEAWYPGWEARVGGQSVPCFPVNGWMRGVQVPPGATSLRLTFRQRGLRLGCAWSAAAAVVLAGVGGVRLRRGGGRGECQPKADNRPNPVSTNT